MFRENLFKPTLVVEINFNCQAGYIWFVGTSTDFITTRYQQMNLRVKPGVTAIAAHQNSSLMITRSVERGEIDDYRKPCIYKSKGRDQ